jgi:hypothetical protein
MSLNRSQTDAWNVVRTIKLKSPLTGSECEDIYNTLKGYKGIHKVTAKSGSANICLAYDASVIDYQSIVKTLKLAGVNKAQTLWEKIKDNWYQYTDTNARENANLPPPSCCNKPPK